MALESFEVNYVLNNCKTLETIFVFKVSFRSFVPDYERKNIIRCYRFVFNLWV